MAAININRFQYDEQNEAEMDEHDVKFWEVEEVRLSETWRLRKNKRKHRAKQPYIMIGFTEAGRLLWIPIQPVDKAEGVWRPATAFTP
ncbi:MAG: hypothetical protein AB7J35_14295 [Dehalococcoidia bacterium]